MRATTYKPSIRKSVVVDFSEYRPLPKQALFHKTCDEKRFVLFCCGVRFGKTFSGARQLRRNIYRWKVDCNLHWILVPTYVQGKQPCEEFEAAVQGCIIKTTGRPGRPMSFFLKPPAGSRFPYIQVDCRSAENPNTLRGPKVASIWEDELRDIPREAHMIGKQRIADVGGRMFGTTTPQGKHHYMFEDWYVPAINGHPDYGYVNASTYENTHLSQEVIAELEASFPGDFARQELYGEFVSLSGVVYKDFDREKHVWQQGEFKLPTDFECQSMGEPPARIFCAIDFGYADPFVCLWIADWKNKYWILDEYVMPGKVIGQHAEHIRRHPLAKRVLAYYCDPNDLKSRMELRATGIENVFAAPRDGSGGDTNFTQGIRLIARLLIEEKIKIMPACHNLIKEFTLYHYADKKDKSKGESPADKFNHCLDAMRYGSRSWTTYRHSFNVTKTETEISGPGWSPNLMDPRYALAAKAREEKTYPSWYLE